MTLTNKKRLSITLDKEEAAFLYELLADTGNGGPLWDDEPDNPYSLKQRRAWWRLVAMIKRGKR